MNRWNISLYQLRRDLVNEQYKQEQEQEQYKTPCDYPDSEGHFNCPFNAIGGDDCRRFCGLGVDE